ncbi:hypothetical protein UMZ34_17710 [Halopseudomonas pachastrellae]|nr:hypothetical protein UMZ34_17710 [Halopseudomonas pachastrellae]
MSLVAGTIEFDQSPSDFRAAIAGLIADLEAAGAFSDTDHTRTHCSGGERCAGALSAFHG